MKPVTKATLEAADSVMEQMKVWSGPEDTKATSDHDVTKENMGTGGMGSHGSYGVKAATCLNSLLQTQETCYQKLTEKCRTMPHKTHTESSLIKRTQAQLQNESEALFSASHEASRQQQDEKYRRPCKSLKPSYKLRPKSNSDSLRKTLSSSTEIPTYENLITGTSLEHGMRKHINYGCRLPSSEPNVGISLSPTLVRPSEEWWVALEDLPIPKPERTFSPHNTWPRPMNEESDYEESSPWKKYPAAFLAQKKPFDQGPNPSYKWRSGLQWHYWNEDSDDSEESMTFEYDEEPMCLDESNPTNDLSAQTSKISQMDEMMDDPTTIHHQHY